MSIPNIFEIGEIIITPQNIAVFILTFFVGLFIAKIIKGRGIGGCLTYVISLIVVIMIISALIKGYSYLFEQLTYSLEYYIYYNAIGVLGAFLGFLLGLAIFRNR